MNGRSIARAGMAAYGPTRLALLLGTAALGCLASAPALAQQKSPPPEAAVEEVIVTGTSIRGEQPVGSDLVSLQRDEIVSMGAASTVDLLTKVPQLNSFNNTPRPGLGGATGVATAPGLRGLPAGATLTLLDGNRFVGDSPLQTTPDPSSIPAAAIERIEIVADGASAIYGSDAVAGVINIITRKNLDGAETSIRVGRARHGYNMVDLSQALGRTWSGGYAMLVVGYTEHDDLRNQDIPGYTNDLRPFGGVDLRPTNCFPSNIKIGATTYAPPNYAPGTPVRCEPGALADAIPDTRRTSVLGNVRQQVTPDLSVFGELKYTTTYIASHNAPSNANVTITTANPFFFRPPGTTATSESVLYNVQPLVGDPMTRAYAHSGNVIAGLNYNLPHDWRATASANMGWSQSEAGNFTFDTVGLNAAAAGTTTATALDPFGHGTNPALAAAIANFVNVNGSEQKLYDYEIRADGPLFNLPAGAVKLALGADYRRTAYDATSSSGAEGQNQTPASSSAVRNVKAGFVELFVPLVGPDNALPLVQSLNVSVAGRYDSYSDFGSTFNPKVGVTWAPFSDLTIRGSYGKSFHAPDMGDSYAVDTRAIFFANFAISPPGQAPVDSIVLAGGNPGLKPEKGKTYSVGAEYAPSWLPGLRASATYYAIDYTDQIQTAPLSQQIFINPAYSTFYVLNPTRAQLDEIGRTFRLISMALPIPQVGAILDLRRNNLASTRTRGIDFAATYHWATDFGTWAAGVSGNRILSREVRSTSVSPFVGQPDIQKWRARGSLGWLDGPWSANAAVNYSGSSQITYSRTAGGTGTQEVKPFVTLDLRAAYQLPDRGWLDGTTLSLNVDNALDEPAPFQIAGGAGVAGANPLGRTVWLGLLKKW